MLPAPTSIRPRSEPTDERGDKQDDGGDEKVRDPEEHLVQEEADLRHPENVGSGNEEDEPDDPLDDLGRHDARLDLLRLRPVDGAAVLGEQAVSTRARQQLAHEPRHDVGHDPADDDDDDRTDDERDRGDEPVEGVREGGEDRIAPILESVCVIILSPLADARGQPRVKDRSAKGGPHTCRVRTTGRPVGLQVSCRLLRRPPLTSSDVARYNVSRYTARRTSASQAARRPAVKIGGQAMTGRHHIRSAVLVSGALAIMLAPSVIAGGADGDTRGDQPVRDGLRAADHRACADGSDGGWQDDRLGPRRRPRAEHRVRLTRAQAAVRHLGRRRALQERSSRDWPHDRTRSGPASPPTPMGSVTAPRSSTGRPVRPRSPSWCTHLAARRSRARTWADGPRLIGCGPRSRRARL